MAYMFEVLYRSPIDPKKDAELISFVNTAGGSLDCQFVPWTSNSTAVTLGFVFRDRDIGIRTTQQLYEKGYHVEPGGDYPDESAMLNIERLSETPLRELEFYEQVRITTNHPHEPKLKGKWGVICGKGFSKTNNTWTYFVRPENAINHLFVFSGYDLESTGVILKYEDILSGAHHNVQDGPKTAAEKSIPDGNSPSDS